MTTFFPMLVYYVLGIVLGVYVERKGVVPGNPFKNIDLKRVQRIGLYNNDQQTRLSEIARTSGQNERYNEIIRELGIQYMTDVPYLLYYTQKRIKQMDSLFDHLPTQKS